MTRPEYQELIAQRPSIGDPETLFAAYNAFVHCKPEFVRFVLQNSDEVYNVGSSYVNNSGAGGGGTGAGYIGWIDFGIMAHHLIQNLISRESIEYCYLRLIFRHVLRSGRHDVG